MNRNESSDAAPPQSSSSGRLRRRFWIDSALSVLTAILAALTVIWPDWIELLFGTQPDASNGSVEVALTVGMVIVSVVSVLLARLEWRSRLARVTV